MCIKCDSLWRGDIWNRTSDLLETLLDGILPWWGKLEIFWDKEDDPYPTCRFVAVEQIQGQCSGAGPGSIRSSRTWATLKHQEEMASGSTERLPAAGDRGPRLPSWPVVSGGLLLARASDSGCCWLLKLVWPSASDYYSLLLCHVSTNTISRGDLENSKCDCMALGAIQGHRGPSGDLNPAGKGEGTRKWWGVVRRGLWIGNRG